MSVDSIYMGLFTEETTRMKIQENSRGRSSLIKGALNIYGNVQTQRYVETYQQTQSILKIAKVVEVSVAVVVVTRAARPREEGRNNPLTEQAATIIRVPIPNALGECTLTSSQVHCKRKGHSRSGMT